MSNNPAGVAGALPDSASRPSSLSAAAPQVFDESDRLLILTPCYDWTCTTVWQQSIDMVRQTPSARFRMADGSVQILPIVAGFITIPNDSHIDRARNMALWHFEQSHYRKGLWFDADQELLPEHIASLWRHLMQGVKLVGGLVALKSIVPTFVANSIKGKVPDPLTGLVEVLDIGTGCMAFDRSLIDEMRVRFPEIVYTGAANQASAGKRVHAYFASGIVERGGTRDWLSEDWMFCHRTRLMGYPVYADATVKVRHLGKMLFPPEPISIIEAAATVTGGANPPFPKRLAEAVRLACKNLLAEMKDTKISVLHATRRPEKAMRIRELFHENAVDPGAIEYIFAVDSDDAPSLGGLRDFYPVVVDPARGIVKAINAAAARSTGRILVMAADDCLPPPRWDSEVRAALAGQTHEPRVLAVSDGYTNQPVITQPIMTRAFYEEQGYFFCPEYAHLFCDTELTVRAQAAGQIVDGRHIVFRHQHPMFTGDNPDALHLERNSREAWEAGRATFQRRNPGINHPHAREAP